MRHNINGSLPWVMAEKHARLHVLESGQSINAEHHTVISRYQDEQTAQAALLASNEADAMVARRGGPKSLGTRYSRRYIVRSEITYSDIMRDAREREAINQLIASIQTIAAI